MIATDRRIPVPPWTIIVPQLMWLLSAFMFVCFGCLSSSTFNFSMAGFSVFLIVGLYLRWRVAFWLSALCYAVIVGYDIAKILASVTPPPSAVLGAVISVAILILHQKTTSMRWFGIERQRIIRFLFWLLSALACVAYELWIIHFLPKPD
jgi:hypothetical protein